MQSNNLLDLASAFEMETFHQLLVDDQWMVLQVFLSHV